MQMYGTQEEQSIRLPKVSPLKPNEGGITFDAFKKVLLVDKEEDVSKINLTPFYRITMGASGPTSGPQTSKQIKMTLYWIMPGPPPA